MRAGLPLDLPDLTQGVDIALIPILSDSRGIALVLKKWLKKNRLPDAIVIEHPGHAGGHLGVASVADIPSERFDFARVIEGRIQPVVATSRNLEVLNGATVELGLATNREANDAIAGQARCQSV